METMTGTRTYTHQRTASTQVELYDETGRLIGVITRPVTPDVLGPGREKVYLSRRVQAAIAARKAPQAA